MIIIVQNVFIKHQHILHSEVYKAKEMF